MESPSHNILSSCCMICMAYYRYCPSQRTIDRCISCALLLYNVMLVSQECVQRQPRLDRSKCACASNAALEREWDTRRNLRLVLLKFLSHHAISNHLSLARMYFCVTPFVLASFCLRDAVALGVGAPTAAACSTLIQQHPGVFPVAATRTNCPFSVSLVAIDGEKSNGTQYRCGSQHTCKSSSSSHSKQAVKDRTLSSRIACILCTVRQSIIIAHYLHCI